ncbi:MAG: hypothetical protein JW860_05230 [Sedimentisphaerales bacterium]|nr:hypothetical protein [Sedimentisphaerales bacterium]
MFCDDMKSGSEVRFKLSSVICPDQEQVIENITNRLALTGKILQLSDAGDKRNFYAVVQVGGIMNPLIVPISEIEICSASLEEEKLKK